MAGEVSKAIPAKELWEGGRSPFSMSYGKLMMWLFLISDALTLTNKYCKNIFNNKKT